MTYLTQALLDYDVAARQKLQDLYDWHQLVWKAFPGRDGQPRDFLTRLDRRESEQRFRLLIVSTAPPARPHVWPDGPTAWDTRELTPTFVSCPRYRFQLRANPTKRDNATRKRLALRTAQEQSAWLQRKASQSGFVVDEDSLRIIPEGREWFHIDSRNQGGFHHSVEFEGVLAVIDRQAFQSALSKGIGSAKGFGFGLLAVVPLSRPEP